VKKRCDGLFRIDVAEPILDEERLELYARYQQGQHGDNGQAADPASYHRFLVESITDTLELAWRDDAGALVAVGVLDVTPNGLSTVYFYWDPSLAHLSLGIYSALVEIDLCRAWNRPYYYLGYLVAGSETMSYKAGFAGSEVWDGKSWVPLPARSLADPPTLAILGQAEAQATEADRRRFPVAGGRELPPPPDGEP
jgi:arginine-tRNA-protein transferase